MVTSRTKRKTKTMPTTTTHVMEDTADDGRRNVGRGGIEREKLKRLNKKMTKKIVEHQPDLISGKAIFVLRTWVSCLTTS